MTKVTPERASVVEILLVIIVLAESCSCLNPCEAKSTKWQTWVLTISTHCLYNRLLQTIVEHLSLSLHELKDALKHTHTNRA